MKPVIRWFHDEQTVDFVDLQTGEFAEVMRIRSNKDADKFLEKYDLHG